MKKGVAGTHERQSLELGPSHNAQLEWQAAHVSDELLLPPEQVKPSSI